MTQRGQWIFVLGIVGVLIGGLVVGMMLTPALAPLGVQSPAPAFEARDVRTGDVIRLADYDDEVLLVNIWATWCGPCEQEMPAIQHLQDSLGPHGFRVVAVSVDNATEDVLAWVEERGFTFTVLHDPSGRIERDYQTTGVPESFVLDRDRIIVKKVIGAIEWDHPTQVAQIERLLGGNDAETDESD